jgi:pyruvate-ferredoxin/flavodoxin oxidoreductase
LITCAYAQGAKVGSIHVNVIRPFPEAAVVNALKGKKNVIILERTDEALAGDNPLGRDIRTALSKAIAGRPSRRPEGLPAITLERCPGFLAASMAGLARLPARARLRRVRICHRRRARKDGKVAADGVVHGARHRPSLRGVGDETPSLLPEGAVAVRFHSIGGWGAITTGKNLGAIIGDLNDLLYERDKIVDELGNPKEVIHVSANPKYGSEKKGRADRYFMVAAPESIRVNCDLAPRDGRALCCDPKAFTHTNPLDGMAEAAAWCGSRTKTASGLGAAAVMWARKQIIDQNIRVFTLPGSKLRARRPTAATCNCACRATRSWARSLR